MENKQSNPDITNPFFESDASARNDITSEPNQVGGLDMSHGEEEHKTNEFRKHQSSQ